MKRSIAAVLVVLLILLALSGCYSKQDIDDAYDNGYGMGHVEGYSEAKTGAGNLLDQIEDVINNFDQQSTSTQDLIDKILYLLSMRDYFI